MIGKQWIVTEVTVLFVGRQEMIIIDRVLPLHEQHMLELSILKG